MQTASVTTAAAPFATVPGGVPSTTSKTCIACKEVPPRFRQCHVRAVKSSYARTTRGAHSRDYRTIWSSMYI